VNHLFRAKMARQKAEAFLREERLEALPVDPFSIAQSRGIIVQPKPDTADGVSGMLIRHGNTFGIMYATYVKSDGFQRFSVAHELGHYFLEGHVDHVLKDGFHESRAGFVTADPYELEADSFAAGLLMPSGAFKRAIGRRDPGLGVISELADDCRTSLTATAIRYAELTGDAVAVVVSTRGIIDYCILSEAMKTLPGLAFIRKGTDVPSGTATAAFASVPEKVSAGAAVDEETLVRFWLGGTSNSKTVSKRLALERMESALPCSLLGPSGRSKWRTRRTRRTLWSKAGRRALEDDFHPERLFRVQGRLACRHSDRLHMLVAPQFVQTLRELPWDDHSFIDDVAVFEAEHHERHRDAGPALLAADREPAFRRHLLVEEARPQDLEALPASLTVDL